MSDRLLLGFFAEEDEVLSATRALRGSGLQIADIYAPYAVHGLDKAMGLKPSRLPWICFALGLAGAAFKVWFEIWTSAEDWAINVGGKPFNSLPAFVPVTFEVMVLCAGLSTVLAFLIAARLYPGKKAPQFDAAVSDDQFIIAIEQNDAAFDPKLVAELLSQHGVVRVEERVGASQ